MRFGLPTRQGTRDRVHANKRDTHKGLPTPATRNITAGSRSDPAEEAVQDVAPTKTQLKWTSKGRKPQSNCAFISFLYQESWLLELVGLMPILRL